MRWMPVLALACVLAGAGAAAAKYTPPSFDELVFESSVVVVGRIETLRDEDYDLRVEEALVGAGAGELVRVQRFADWACAQRSPPYAVGQRVVAFLTSTDEGLRAVGGGCAGEVILEGRKARLAVFPRTIGADREELSERRFFGAVRALVTGYREVGAPGYVDAWRGLLSHAEPIVVAGALERLDAEAVVNPGPASAFADAIVGVIGHSDRRIRLQAALHAGDWLGRAEREAAGRRLGDAMKSSPPELRPAAAVAQMELAPLDAGRHVALIRLLTDEAIPLAERVAAAAALTSYGAPGLRGAPLDAIDPAWQGALATIRDPSLRDPMAEYVARLRGRSCAAPDRADSREDAYLTPLERAVFVPRDVKDRPRIAKLVRAARRARNAHTAGDDVTALDAYRDVCGALPYLDDAQRKAIRELGIDLDDLARDARSLDAAPPK